MDEHQDPEGTTQTDKDKLIDAAGDLKEAASARIEDFRQAAGQKTDEVRETAQGKAQELGSAAESAWSDVSYQAKSWLAEGESYVRDNPSQSVLFAFGVGLLLGFLLRK